VCSLVYFVLWIVFPESIESNWNNCRIQPNNGSRSIFETYKFNLQMPPRHATETGNTPTTSIDVLQNVLTVIPSTLKVAPERNVWSCQYSWQNSDSAINLKTQRFSVYYKCLKKLILMIPMFHRQDLLDLIRRCTLRFHADFA